MCPNSWKRVLVSSQLSSVGWPGGGWTLTLDPHGDTLSGSAGHLRVGLRARLPELLDPAQEGVTLNGPPRVTVEKDFGPQHG